MKIPFKTKYILGSLTLLFFTFGFVKSTIKVYQSSKRLEDFEKEASDLEGEKAKLEEEIKYKKTSEYIEEKARNELNLVRSGEKVYVIRDTSDESFSNVLSETVERFDSSYKDGNWYMWYKLFF